MLSYNNGEYFIKSVAYRNDETGEYATLFIHNVSYIVCTNEMSFTTKVPVKAHNFLRDNGFKELKVN